MSKVSAKIRAMVKLRLAAVAEEIFLIMERTMTEYEEEIRAQLYGPGGALHVGATQLLGSEDTAPPSGPSFLDNNDNDEDVIMHYEPGEVPGPSFGNPDFSINTLNSSHRSCMCPVCEQFFRNKKELDQHMSSHMYPITEEELFPTHRANTVQVRRTKKRILRPFSCLLCGTDFSSKQSLESHMSLHSQQQTDYAIQPKRKEYQCTICGRSFTYERCLQTHLLMHGTDSSEVTSTALQNTHSEKNMPFSCSVCGQGFYTERLLARHQSKHPELKTSKPQTEKRCTVCGKEYSNKGSLVRHMEMHKMETSHSCSFCGEIFEAVDALQEHVSAHISQTIATEDTGNDTGNLSPNSQESGLIKLNPMHLVQLSGQKRSARRKKKKKDQTTKQYYFCKTCGELCVGRKAFILHRQTHKMTYRPNLFKCSLCYRTFNYEKALTSHMEEHLMKDDKSDRPFSCSVCAQRFYTERLLAHHQSTHPELKAAKPQTEKHCPVCGKKYYNKASLVRHIEMHKLETSCSCSFCGEIFEAVEDLQEHMSGHIPQTSATEDTGSQTFKPESGQEEPEEACTGEDAGNSSPKSQETNVHPSPQRDESEKVDNNKASLVEDMEMHTIQSSCSCSVCGETFETEKDLEEHASSHSNPNTQEELLNPPDNMQMDNAQIL